MFQAVESPFEDDERVILLELRNSFLYNVSSCITDRFVHPSEHTCYDVQMKENMVQVKLHKQSLRGFYRNRGLDIR